MAASGDAFELGLPRARVRGDGGGGGVARRARERVADDARGRMDVRRRVVGGAGGWNVRARSRRRPRGTFRRAFDVDAIRAAKAAARVSARRRRRKRKKSALGLAAFVGGARKVGGGRDGAKKRREDDAGPRTRDVPEDPVAEACRCRAAAATALAEFARRRPDHPATPALLRDALACAAVDAKESIDESIDAETKTFFDAAIATFLVDALDAFVAAPLSVSMDGDVLDAAASLCEIAHDVAANASKGVRRGSSVARGARPERRGVGTLADGSRRRARPTPRVRGRDGRSPRDASSTTRGKARGRNRPGGVGGKSRRRRRLTCLTCLTCPTSPTRSVWRRR